MEKVEKAYRFSAKREHGGIRIDIAIEAKSGMAMSDMLGRFAALSHEVYLDMARDIKGEKHS